MALCAFAFFSASRDSLVGQSRLATVSLFWPVPLGLASCLSAFSSAKLSVTACWPLLATCQRARDEPSKG